MKPESNRVPIVVEDMARNLFNADLKTYIRENYKMSLISIRDYCNDMIITFDRQQAKEQNKRKKA